MGGIMSAKDWSSSQLGAPVAWPQSLRSVMGLLLSSKFPMFIAWGAERTFLYNDSYIEVLGGKHPSALGRPLREVWAEVWHEIEPMVDLAFYGTSSFYQDLPVSLNRNSYVEPAWFTFSYSPIFGESGEVAGVFCVLTETTERVLAERHREDQHERLRALFQQAPGIIAVLQGPNHVFDIANDAYARLVGNRDLIGKPVCDALPEVVEQGFIQVLDNVYASGVAFVGNEISVMLQRAPGEPLEERFVNFIYQPTFDHRGAVTGIFVEGSDVTDTVEAFKKVTSSEERLRQLANTIPHLAWMANPDGWIHWYNDRWYEYTGKTFEEMQGWGWKSVHHPDTLDSVVEAWTSSIVSGQPFELSFPLAGKDGVFRRFFTRVAPLRDAAGNIVQWFGTNTDVTALEQAQEDLKLANKRKDEFLAMLAHELRNPLAPIATAASLLKLTAPDEDRVRKTSEVIARQVQHMAQLLDDLLDVSRVTRGVVTLQSGIFDIGTLIADAVEQVQQLVESKLQKLTVQTLNQNVSVKGDRTRLVQIFSNILNNAAKYTQPNGNIKLSVESDGAFVSVSIEDDGPGISPALLPFVFDLFTQAERAPGRTQGGLGLGLALVKNLVEIQGGSVSAKSNGDNTGSCFTVRLPQVADAFEPAVPAPQPFFVLKTKRPTRALIVDDNKDAAELLMLSLNAAGHEAYVAHTGQGALDLAKSILPHALFLDIGLPDLDGYQVAKKIRSMPQMDGAILVALTGYGQPQDELQAKAAGFDHHLVKPAKMEAVLSLLQSVTAG